MSLMGRFSLSGFVVRFGCVSLLTQKKEILTMLPDQVVTIGFENAKAELQYLQK